MEDPRKHPPTDLDAYLDNLLSAEERLLFEQRARDEGLYADGIELQRRIDDSLRKHWNPPPCPAHILAPIESPRLNVEHGDANGQLTDLAKVVLGNVAAAAHGAASDSVRPRWRRALLVASLVLAASIAWCLVVWQLPSRKRPEIPFVAKPVATIYRETVERGFQPYWVCEEPERFAETFRHRQQQGLALKELSDGARMAGLSYLPALSPQTTAMLAWVDAKPVIVFVDRLERDQPLAEPARESGLRIFRQVLGDLVLYELTPHSRAHLLEAFQLADPPPPGGAETGRRHCPRE